MKRVPADCLVIVVRRKLAPYRSGNSVPKRGRLKRENRHACVKTQSRDGRQHEETRCVEPLSGWYPKVDQRLNGIPQAIVDEEQARKEVIIASLVKSFNIRKKNN